MRFAFFFLALSAILPCSAALGQSKTAAKPIVGLRENRPSKFALTHARAITQPGEVIEDATILIDDTSIVSIGKQREVPAGYLTIDCTGKTVYPGLIDAYSEADIPSEQTAAGHWNELVTPQRNAAAVASSSRGDVSKLRSQGITVRVIAPQSGIVKGSSSVVLLDDGKDAGRLLLNPIAWHHLNPTVPQPRTHKGYPNSPMGAVALLRQTFYDAGWYSDAWQAYRASPNLPRPETNVALAALANALKEDTFVIDAANERMSLRADRLADEFSLKCILRGSGREYRDLDAITATGRPILVTVDFPKKPSVETADAARNSTLTELLHWDLAKRNPAMLARAGVTFCLTTDRLKNTGDFLKQVRVAVQHGLAPDDALASLTTAPAKLLNMDATIGKLQPGMLANVVITDGDLFAKETKVLETWVAGKQHLQESAGDLSEEVLSGTWQLSFKQDDQDVKLNLTIESNDKKELSAALLALPEKTQANAEETTNKEADADENEDDKTEASKLKSLVRQHDRLTALVDLSTVHSDLAKGLTRITLLIIDQDASLDTIDGSLQLPNGNVVPIQLQRRESEQLDQTREEELEEKVDEEIEGKLEGKLDEKPDEADKKDNAAEVEDEANAEPTSEQDAITQVYPLGAYGLDKPVWETPTVLFRSATVWTSDDAGTIENCDVLIRDGRIIAVGKDIQAPTACHVFDAKGKHITAGLIDCHSHMATDGGVNESGQSVTAEVRIGDFIDNTDINIYRQLAGGLTAANILHGSANPIGGQNQVIKLRWGQSMDDLRMKEAPGGIKFALGENVKRNTSRYPNTRMGVQALFRDQFLAAREYEANWRSWREGNRDKLPPRRDLQLEAISEIQRGERWIHCHSYRQDEIVATLDVLEEFGVQIGTLQHILEGYKVADRMKRHGAMASSFSDWWAYKFEVFDAIPYNGALMHQQGVVVSFNSDDRELGRHLNTEAAKAVKYGGVSPDEALKFVTLNPAKQLRIDQHVGSITVGKHADLVVWSGPPLSTTSRCEQTWIDGRRYFDLETDAKLRKRDAALHARLVQKALADPSQSDTKSDKQPDEEDRWDRHDVFCGAHGEDGHAHTRWERQ